MIRQLTPFNEQQFDRCMLWFSRHYNTALDQFLMIKLHVMTDVYHVLALGRPVIGGTLEAWPHGPVVKPAFNRIKRRAYRSNDGVVDPLFEIHLAQGSETKYQFRARPDVEIDEGEFSQSEINAMERAWDTIKSRNTFPELYNFFHNPDESFMGRAWSDARANGQPVDWCVIVDAYDQENATDHAHVKDIICAAI